MGVADCTDLDSLCHSITQGSGMERLDNQQSYTQGSAVAFCQVYSA